MARSHPPSVLTSCRRALLDEVRCVRGARLLVAVSGGVDSMVLLHSLARLAPELELLLCAHGVDHGLRPAAATELDLAAELCEELKVPFTRSALRVAPGGNLQARARTARYAALRSAAAEASAAYIATAHHADDRAETVLLRLLRGGSARGLGVLPALSGDLVRPLIRARRAAIEAHASRHQLKFAQDPSNHDPRYLRTRVRHELLPLLRALSPGIVENLTALADEQLSEPLPVLLASDGTRLTLGRAQRLELTRMLERPTLRACLRLSAGRKLYVEPRTRRIVVEE
ncbi:MAG: tRNA lysidine(34) synthetase TilS [Polyangiaceae bacterium]